MKVYVAGRFTKKEDVRKVQQVVRDAGHEITFDWTTCDDTGLSGKALEDLWIEGADNDLNGVVSANVVVLVPEWDGCGQYIEIGAMLGLIRFREIFGPGFAAIDMLIGHRRVIVVGDREHWKKRTCFMAMPVVEYTTLEDLPDLLKEEEVAA